MFVKSLLIDSNYEEVEKELLRLFSTEEENVKSGYFEIVYYSLIELDPISSTIHITQQTQNKKLFPHQLICTDTLSKEVSILSGHTWSECLGMTIDNSILQQYSLNEITAILLFNLTFFGYTEKEINNNIISHNHKCKIVYLDDYRKSPL